jgi:4-hydroxy-3-polyprenylbenzoate decarboxylase
MRLIVGMTGATGSALGIQLLRELRGHDEVETHLVLSRWARATIDLETELSVSDVTKLADVSYSPDDQGAAISSGSFRTDAMVIVPCSMKTLAGIRAGYADSLVPSWSTTPLLPAEGDGRLPHSSFAQAYPAEVQDRVLTHWKD